MKFGQLLSRVLASAFFLTSTAAPQAGAPTAPHPMFETDVLPILQANCVRCHGPKLKVAHLDLSTYDQVLKGSESGEVVVPGKPNESKLYEKIHKGLMPADKKGALSSAQIEIIRKWIEAGAPTVSASN